MPLTEMETGKIERHEEEARLAALVSLGILDTPPEPATTPLPGWPPNTSRPIRPLSAFADESRVWMKSHCGEHVRELPRKNSIFDMVLAEDGPVMMTDRYGQSILDEQAHTPQTTRHEFLCRVFQCALSTAGFWES